MKVVPMNINLIPEGGILKEFEHDFNGVADDMRAVLAIDRNFVSRLLQAQKNNPEGRIL